MGAARVDRILSGDDFRGGVRPKYRHMAEVPIMRLLGLESQVGRAARIDDMPHEAFTGSVDPLVRRLRQ